MGGILLIDAEQPFADQLAGSLKGRGFSVKLMDDGKDGLDYATKSRPDLIVLCVELPKMSGYSICNKLKKDNDLKSIPLIITSKEATPETFAQHKKLKTRAEDYLIKPFSDAELLEKIGALIPLPAGTNGAAVAAAAPPAGVDDALDALESLGADLNLGPSTGGDESAVKIDDSDFASLDVGNAGAGGGSLGLSPEDDALLASLDDLGKSDPQPEVPGLDDLDLGSSSSSSMGMGTGDFDSAFDSIAPEAAPPAPPPRPEPKPEPPKARDPLPRTGSSTSMIGAASSSADLQQLSQLRREAGDFKAKIAELEARLRAAEETARNKDQQIAAAASAAGGSAAGSAREVLNLKEQLRAKDKEIGSLKDEVFEKEKTNVDLQEQIEAVRSEANAKVEEAQGRAKEKEIDITRLTAKIESLSEERDELEQQVQGRLQQAESERDQLAQQLDATKIDLGRAKNDMDKIKANEERLKMDLDRSKVDADGERKGKQAAEQKAKDLEAKVRDVETEVRKQEERALKAYERMKQDEKVRDRAKQAAQLAYRLLNGEVEAGDGGAVDLDQLDAE